MVWSREWFNPEITHLKSYCLPASPSRDCTNLIILIMPNEILDSWMAVAVDYRSFNPSNDPIFKCGIHHYVEIIIEYSSSGKCTVKRTVFYRVFFYKLPVILCNICNFYHICYLCFSYLEAWTFKKKRWFSINNLIIYKNSLFCYKKLCSIYESVFPLIMNYNHHRRINHLLIDLQNIIFFTKIY